MNAARYQLRSGATLRRRAKMSMTVQQVDQLTRAEQIARRDGLRAIKGTNGVWAVLNRSETKRTGVPCYHLLHVEHGRILCPCQWSQRHPNLTCPHAAAVRLAMVEERKERERAHEEHAVDEVARRRETSPIARPAPVGAFSIFR
jgi:hypothetical protein